MPQWAPFLAVVAILTVLLLLLAHQSQQFLHEHADESGSGRNAETGHEYSVETGHENSLETGRENSLESGRETVNAHASPVESHEDSAETRDVDAVPGSDGAVGEAESAANDGLADDGTATAANSTVDAAHVIRADEPAPRDPQGNTAPAHQHHGREVVLTPGVLLANVAFTQALVAAILVAAAWYFSIPASALGLEEAAVPNSGVALGLGVAFGVGLWIGNELSTVVADAVGATYDETVREMLAPATTGGWLFLFGGVLPLIAVTEELLFRAALIGVPASGLGTSAWLLALVSSVAFAFGHGAQGRVGIVVTGLLGLTLAAGFVLTGSLLVVVVAHYVINTLEFLVHEYLGIASLYGSSS